MILHSYPEIVDVKSGDEKRKQVEKEEAKLLYIIVTIFNFGRLTVEINNFISSIHKAYCVTSFFFLKTLKSFSYQDNMMTSSD